LSNILANLEAQHDEAATQWVAASQANPNAQEEFVIAQKEFVKIIKKPMINPGKSGLSRSKSFCPP
jgi:hypothetical protein